MHRSALDRDDTNKPCVTSKAKGRQAKSSSKLLSLAGAVGLAAAAAMTPNDAEAAWIDDGCTTPSIGAIWEVAGDPGSDDHLFTAQSDELAYLKDSGSSSYTAINTIISTYKTSYSGDILLPHDIEGDFVLMGNYTDSVLFSVSLAELRAGTISALTEYSGSNGGYASVSSGRVFATTSSDHNTIYEFSTGASPTALFSDSTGDFLGASIVDISNSRAYATDASDEIREYSSISGSVTPTYTGFQFDVFSLIDESIASTGFRTLVGVDYAASSGGDVCVIYNDSYPAPVLTDTDGDGVYDDVDDCPTQDASGYDIDGDGCIDDIDGDGSLADEDCDDNDDAVYPGATEIEEDGIDQNCDYNDGPRFDSTSIEGDTYTGETLVVLGDTIRLAANVFDGEDFSEDLEILWGIEFADGSSDTGEGANIDIVPNVAGECIITILATDSDDNETTSEMILNVRQSTENFTGECQEGDVFYADPTDPHSGSFECTGSGVTIDENGDIHLTEGGSIEIAGMALDIHGEAAGVVAHTDSEFVGEAFLGIVDGAMMQDPPPPSDPGGAANMYSYMDADIGASILGIILDAGTVSAEGDYDLDVEIEIPGTYYFSDLGLDDDTEPTKTDSDGDGVDDENDRCPEDDASGNDEDKDGCTDEEVDPGDNNKDPDGGCSTANTKPSGRLLATMVGFAAFLGVRRKREDTSISRSTTDASE